MRVNLQQAVTKLQQGEVVAIPTETVYGLAADARNDSALQQIYAIKQRPADHPLIVHIADAAQVIDWAAEFSPLAQQLAQAFWPGPFTLVLPALPQVSTLVRGGESTVALRVPAHTITRQLLLESGLALAAPSANKFTQLSPTAAAHVTAGLGEYIPVLDGGACQVGIESTIVSVVDDQWQILRLGMVSEAEIMQVAQTPALKNTDKLPKAPGQHLLHYSPKTPIKLFKSREDLLEFATDQKVTGQKVTSLKKVAMMLMAGIANPTSPEIFSLPNEPHQAATYLYEFLHAMDALKCDWILIELPPRQMEWLAIHDRLSRAAYELS